MKLLGRGWQYSTYDIGNHRVLKKFNSRLVSYYMMLHDSFPYVVNPPWKYPKFYNRALRESINSRKIVEESTIPKWMLGNPVYRNDLDYEQDIAQPVYEALIEMGEQKREEAIDDFIALNIILLNEQIVDRGFVITTNFSINKDGKIILTDLGELYHHRDMIAKLLTMRPWAEDHVLYRLPQSLRKYFIESMDATFYQSKSSE